MIRHALYSLACVILLACGSTSSPEDAVHTMIAAINRQDSLALLNSFSQTYRDNLKAQPAALSQLLDTTRGAQFDVKIYSVSQEGTTARVLYGVRATGRYNLYLDSVYGEVYQEEDGWKYGSLLSKQPFLKVRKL